MPRKMKTKFQVGRIYKMTTPRNGKPAGCFYQIKDMPTPDLITVVGYNPDAEKRKFSRRTMQTSSLAGYELKLVPYEQEPIELQSDEGKKLRAQRDSEPKWVRGFHQHVRIAHDIMYEINRVFLVGDDVKNEDALLLADGMTALAFLIRQSLSNVGMFDQAKKDAPPAPAS